MQPIFSSCFQVLLILEPISFYLFFFSFSFSLPFHYFPENVFFHSGCELCCFTERGRERKSKKEKNRNQKKFLEIVHGEGWIQRRKERWKKKKAEEDEEEEERGRIAVHSRVLNLKHMWGLEENGVEEEGGEKEGGDEGG